MAVSPAVRRYLAQLDRVSNPKAPCTRVPSKLIGKGAKIKRGPFKGDVRALACSDQEGMVWGSVDGREMDIPRGVLARKNYFTSGRGVRSFVQGRGVKGGRKSLGLEFDTSARKTKMKRKAPRVKRFSGFGYDGTGPGPARLTQFRKATRGPAIPRGKRAKVARTAFRASEASLRAARHSGTRQNRLTRAQLLKLNAERFGSRFKGVAYYEARAAARIKRAGEKASRAAAKPGAVKGAKEVSDSAVQKAIDALPAAETAKVESVGDALAKTLGPVEAQKIARLLMVELAKYPSATRQKIWNEIKLLVARTPDLELKAPGRKSGSKNKKPQAVRQPRTPKELKAAGAAVAAEAVDVVKSNASPAAELGKVGNPRRRKAAGRPARHLIRF